MTSLIDLLSPRLGPIQTCLLQYLDPGAIASLTATCKDFGCLWPRLMASAYNIDHQLRNFFTNPKDFRSAQGESGALIFDGVRPNLLRFFARGDNRGVKTLILHIQDEHTGPMVTYLETEGYTLLDPNELYPGTPQCGNGEMAFLKKRYWVNIEHHKSPPIQRLLEGATSNRLMFLSWSKAYAIFPVETLVKQECLLLSDEDAILEIEVGRFERQRYRKSHAAVSACGSTAQQGESRKIGPKVVSLGGETNDGKELHYDVVEKGPPSTVRKIGDKHTLCLQLDTEGVKAPATPNAVLESATFLLRRYENPFVSQYYEVQHPRYSIQFMSLGHPILKHTYLIPTTNDQFFASNNDLAHRMEDLRIKLDGLTLKEMEKVPEAERPIEFARVRDAHESGSILRDTFPLPVDWTFYDDEVLEELGVAWERRDGV